MKEQDKYKIPVELLRQNGLKVLVLLVLAVVILRKDFVFSINLTSPRQEQQHQQRMPTPAPSQSLKKENKITDNGQSPTAENKSSLIVTPKGKKEPTMTILNKVDKKIREAYVRRFAHVAVDEMKKYGIPASISLAQAMLHSAAGTSAAALNGHNHFNLKCGTKWNGDRINFDTGECYRQYQSAWRSFRNHSEFITTGDYEELKSFASADYKGWAKGLAKKGFSLDKTYEKDLLKLINKYNLNRYDY